MKPTSILSTAFVAFLLAGCGFTKVELTDGTKVEGDIVGGSISHVLLAKDGNKSRTVRVNKWLVDDVSLSGQVAQTWGGIFAVSGAGLMLGGFVLGLFDGVLPFVLGVPLFVIGVPLWIGGTAHKDSQRALYEGTAHRYQSPNVEPSYRLTLRF